MTDLSLIFPFYRNCSMLAHQYATWAAYPDDLKARIEIILVDDGSPEPASEVERPEGLPPLRIYRHLEDRPWCQHAARNRGAWEAEGRWLFLSDIDHVLPAGSLRRILEAPHPMKFRRLDAPDLVPKMKNGQEHPHPNTFLIQREHYLRERGYDEALNGIYGTDGEFVRKLGPLPVSDISVVRYAREVIADASTATLDRDSYRDKARQRWIGKDKKERGALPDILTIPCERVL